MAKRTDWLDGFASDIADRIGASVRIRARSSLRHPKRVVLAIQRQVLGTECYTLPRTNAKRLVEQIQELLEA